jgi:hypothetical protein
LFYLTFQGPATVFFQETNKQRQQTDKTAIPRDNFATLSKTTGA